MSESKLFIQVQGDAHIIEAALTENTTEAELHKTLSIAGAPAAPELFVFIDEAEDPIGNDVIRPVTGMKHGTRVHVTRCRRIKTTVNFLEKTAEREFSPGTRLRRVKAWALEQFTLTAKDGAEHVLQLCNSTERPASDTPLHTLVVHHRDCAICFDLVPEKRVEG